ncbi:MAG: hypothetical protein ABEJ65_03425 [bacterium]
MADRCGINDDHQFESRTGSLKIFRDGSYTEDFACPRCVEGVREGEIQDYRIFVLNGEEVIIPRDEIDV